MKFLRSADERTYDQVRRRLRSVTPTARLMWAGTTLWTVQEHLEHEALEDARKATVALLAAIDSALDKKA